ncbi:MAG: amino acid adenylation domain-containing protein [Acidobacteria bacterium]|nr:amino acid adenylation domain-containing protein [Acidobacteriota bacterium]
MHMMTGTIKKIVRRHFGNSTQGTSAMPVVGDAEHRRVLEWNDTSVDYAEKDLCLHQLIEQQAERSPGQTAVVFEQQKMTYAELNRRANRLAQRLRDSGVGPEKTVGVFVERSLEMIVGILGILKAGGAYVPIDTAFPQERIGFMLEDTKAGIVLTQTTLEDRLGEHAPEVIRLDTFDWAGNTELKQGGPDVRPDNLAYVIYTSGSTGRPKGVCIEHRNIVNYVLGVAQRFQLRSGMNHATVSTVAADLGNTVIFPALATGGCLHIISQERAQSYMRLSEYFERERIDVLKIVPSHLAALQSAGHPHRVMPRARLILGGEASRLEWISQLGNLSPDCRIFNHYGPTETTVGVLTYAVDSKLPETVSGTLPVGRPLPNSRAYILDQQGRPTPVGVAGEIYIGGSGVGRGYLNLPDLTAERFIPDPFSLDGAGRIYRTGDRARYLPDGSIEFLGRVDHQVKIHGYRVELGEIERAIREQEGVQQVVVTANEDEYGSRELVAYVVPKRPHQPLWAAASVHILPDGLPVADLNKNETDYIYNEVFALQAYLRHGITINDGDCIVDAGANIGLFTVFASRLAKNLRIFSFEPNPAAYECLKANAEAWGSWVKCFPHGLSSENKTAEMTFFQGFSLLSGFYADSAKERTVIKTYVSNQQLDSPDDGRFAAEIGEMIDNRFRAKTLSAELRTLSSVIREEGIERIDLLKINVEKSELDVLRGLGPEDWTRIQQLVIEVDEHEKLEPITGLLEQHGYDFLVEQDHLLKNTDLCYVYAIRPSSGRRLIRQQTSDGHIRGLSMPDETILTPAGLRKFLKKRLPQYMVPSDFVLMEKLPLTSNGKIDRESLPAPTASAGVTNEYIAPRDALEQSLADIWAKVLKVERVGIHDDFFDLGGHSLLAVRVIAEFEKLSDKRLPLAMLLQAPTIARLAELLRNDSRDPGWSSLVPIQASGSKPALFLVHDGDGMVILYQQLARYLGPEQPVYGLQSLGLKGDGIVHRSVEEMASHYIQEVMSVQPRGPYYLGGYCLGGAIALEMAQQLSAQGQRVALVAMIDTYNFSLIPQAKLGRLEYLHRLQTLWFAAANLLITKKSERMHFLGQKWGTAKIGLEATLRDWSNCLRNWGKGRKAGGDEYRRVKAANHQAMKEYVPKPYAGRVLLIRPRGHFWGQNDPAFGWDRVLCSPLDCRINPAYPKGIMLDPYLRMVAQALKGCLQEVQEAEAARRTQMPGTAREAEPAGDMAWLDSEQMTRRMAGL